MATARRPDLAVREVLPADLAAFMPFRRCLTDTLARTGWSQLDAFRVLVCADEAVANAVTHCAGGDCAITLGYGICATRAAFSLTNACDGPTPRLVECDGPDEASEHGRGLLLMRALSDDLRISIDVASTTVALMFVPHPGEN